MSVEVADWITDLDPTNPPAGDPIAQAADHIRTIKGALISTFPAITGQVTATHTNLNNVILQATPTGKCVPVYTSTTTAGVVPYTDFGLTLLNLADAAAFNAAIDKSGFVAKSGDTMTGALTLPSANLPGDFKVTIDANGNPMIQFKTGLAIIGNLSLNAIEFYTQGVRVAHFNSAGDLRVLGNIEAYSKFD
ncbi:hypothetical protein ACFZ8E_07450 [Methylobacterium sp. HMF5984]|uniref:hypothetical protein n=1 Tax=Methylobacterium sp. HMF5984 TaxID=3367370 RepID=UPI0038539E8C